MSGSTGPNASTTPSSDVLATDPRAIRRARRAPRLRARRADAGSFHPAPVLRRTRGGGRHDDTTIRRRIHAWLAVDDVVHARLPPRHRPRTDRDIAPSGAQCSGGPDEYLTIPPRRAAIDHAPKWFGVSSVQCHPSLRARRYIARHDSNRAVRGRCCMHRRACSHWRKPDIDPGSGVVDDHDGRIDRQGPRRRQGRRKGRSRQRRR